jgi:hypothetical protein
MPNQGTDQLNIAIYAGQKQKFKQWCGDQGTTITEVMRSLIDYCLEGGLPEFLVVGDNPVIGRPNLDIDEVVNRVVERLSSNNLNQVPHGLSLGERVEKLEKLVNEVLSGTKVNQADLDLIQRIENVEEWVNKLDKGLSSYKLTQPNLDKEQKIEIGEEVLSNNLEQLNLESTENNLEDVLPSDNLFQLNLDKEKQEIEIKEEVLSNNLEDVLPSDSLAQPNLDKEKQEIEIVEEVLSNNSKQLNLGLTENQIEDVLPNDNLTQSNLSIEQEIEIREEVLSNNLEDVLPNDNLFQPNLDKEQKVEIVEEESFDDLSSQGNKERNNTLDNEFLPSVVEVSASLNNDYIYEDTKTEVTRLLNQNPNMLIHQIACHLKENKFPTTTGKYSWQSTQVNALLKKMKMGLAN